MRLLTAPRPLALAILVLSSVVPLRTASGIQARCDSARALRVLFIGNSLTYAHNVPRMVEGIAASMNDGPCVATAMIAGGGMTLEQHWGDDSVRQRVQSGRWTHVVLNDQSVFGESWFVNGRARVGTTGAALERFSLLFADAVRDAGAVPVLLAHWSDDGAPARDQQALDFLFARAERASGVKLIPVGAAIKRMRQSIAGVSPYHADGHHLSAEGAYLSALVTYGALTDQSPIGASPRLSGEAVELARGIVSRDSVVTLIDLPRESAASIQRIAARALGDASKTRRSVLEPAQLAAEFPKVSSGQAVSREILTGRWRGVSSFLPTPSGQTVSVELIVSEDGTADTVVVRLPEERMRARGPGIFVGRAELSIADGVVVISAPVAPNNGIATFRASLRSGILSGIGEVHLDGPGMRTFNSIGRLELRRVKPESR